MTDQLSGLWQGSLPDSATVVSPFFDQTQSALDLVYQHLHRSLRLVATVPSLASAALVISGQTRPLRQPYLARCSTSEEASAYAARTRVGLPSYQGEEAAVRPLHSKAIVLGRGWFVCLLGTGSSNFTVKGLGLDTRPNAELNLAYVVPAGESKFFDACLAALRVPSTTRRTSVSWRFPVTAAPTMHERLAAGRL